jgi:type IV fimbrial biogenesis protein FimT
MHASRPSPGTLRRQAQYGFTVIELMVVVAIVAILAALAAPSFTPLIERWRRCRH